MKATREPSTANGMAQRSLRVALDANVLIAGVRLPRWPHKVMRAALAGVLKALADETRIQIVHSLLRASRLLCECHLVALFDRSQPTVSYHLKALKEAGIVEAEKRVV